MFKKRLMLCVLSALVGACAPERDANLTEGAANDIPMGVYGAMTGPTASFGTATRGGAILAADEINAAGGVLGKKIRLVIEDDQGRPEEAAAVVQKLISKDNVVAVVGENASSASLAAAPICQQNKVPMISPTSTNPEVTQKGDYIFRVCFIDPYQGKAIATYVQQRLGLKRIAILRDIKNDYSIGLANYFDEAFTGQTVANQSYSAGDSDFRGQLTAIKNAKPEAIFVPGYYTDVGQIAIQARDLGITAPLIGGDGWDSPKLLEIGGSALNGAHFANHYFLNEPRPAVQNFVAKYRERFKADPDAAAVLGYDAVKIVADAIVRAGSVDRTAIRDQIAATKDFQGVSGVISYGPDRNPIKPVAMLAVENGQVVFKEWVTP